MEKLFVCCNKNDIITQASGLLLGAMIGYAIFKNDEKKESDNKPIITIDKNGNEVEIGDIEDKTESPAPLDFLDAINSGILEYAGPVYTTIRTGAILITIASLPYRAIIFIRNWIYPQLREVPIQERILRGIGESKQLNLKLLQELKKNIKINKDELLSKAKSQQEKNEIKEQDENLQNNIKEIEEDIKKSNPKRENLIKNITSFLSGGSEEIFISSNKKIPLEEGKIKIDVLGQEVIEESSQIPYLLEGSETEARIQEENINVIKNLEKKIAENSEKSAEFIFTRNFWQTWINENTLTKNLTESQIEEESKKLDSPIILTPEENNLYVDNIMERFKQYNEMKLTYEELKKTYEEKTIEQITEYFNELEELLNSEDFRELVFAPSTASKPNTSVKKFLLDKTSLTGKFYNYIQQIILQKKILFFGPKSKYTDIKLNMSFWNRLSAIKNDSIKKKLDKINNIFIKVKNNILLLVSEYNKAINFMIESPKKIITVEELNTAVNMQGKEEKEENN